jgi:hypothetical protein
MDSLVTQLVQAAGLAPSAHNTQPWLLKAGDQRLDVTFDPERLLPIADPDQSYAWFGLGCLLENVLLTLEQHGQKGDYQVHEEGLTITWRLAAEPPAHARLFAMIAVRQTSRLPYRPDPVPPPAIQMMHAVVKAPCALYTLEQPHAIAEVRRLTAQATAIALKNQELVRELYSWLRFSPSDPRWRRDGLNADCMGWTKQRATAARLLLSPTMVRVLGWFGLRKALLGREQENAPPAPLLCLLTTAEVGTSAAVEAGRNLERVWLAAASHGLVSHPLSRVLDRPATCEKVLQSFGVPRKEHAVNLFRLGFSPKAPRSPRLPTTEIFRPEAVSLEDSQPGLPPL